MAAKKPRQNISGPRQTGTITDWKDKFGWITPSKPINHPMASKRGGKIFLGIEDVVEELDGVGATVSFTLYSDATGLGAGDVKMSKAPAATPAKGATQAKGAAKGTPANGKAAAKGAAGKGFQAPAAKAGAKGPAAPKAAAAKVAAAKALANKSAPTPAEEPAAKKFKGSDKGKGKSDKGKSDKGKSDKGKAKGKGKGKDKGPGEREMIHDEPLTGSVVTWRGKFGWITPHDTIDHPLAQKHQGDLYFTQDDVEDEIDGVGAEVQFMLYQDNKGLGACNVKPA